MDIVLETSMGKLKGVLYGAAADELEALAHMLDIEVVRF